MADLWIATNQSHYWQWERKVVKCPDNFIMAGKPVKAGDKVPTCVQGALRPSILGTYEYIFPRECLPEVLALMSTETFEHHGNYKFGLMRKALGCRKITEEEWKEAKAISPSPLFISGTRRAFYQRMIVPAVAVEIIGVKDDKNIEIFDPSCGVTWAQEGL